MVGTNTNYVSLMIGIPDTYLSVINKCSMGKGTYIQVSLMSLDSLEYEDLFFHHDYLSTFIYKSLLVAQHIRLY